MGPRRWSVVVFALTAALAAAGCAGRAEPAPEGGAVDLPVQPVAVEPALPKAVPPPAPPAAKTSVLDRTLRVLEEARQPGVLGALSALEKPRGSHAEAHADPASRAKIAAAIFKLLEGRDVLVAGAAARALPVWAVPEQGPALVEFMEKTGKFEPHLITALGEIKHPGSVAAIARLFRKHPGPVGEALQKLGPELCEKSALGYMHFDDGRLGNDRIRNEARRLLALWRTSDDALLDQTLRDLASDDARRRWWACDWLHKLDAKHPRRGETAKALEPLLRDTAHQVNRKSLPALLHLGGPENVPCLAEYLLDLKNEFGRREVVLHLGRTRDPRAARPVVRELDTGNYAAAREGVKALGAVAEPELIKLLEHPTAKQRVEAVHLLLIVGTEASVPALQKATQDQHNTVKSGAERALRKIAERAVP